MPAGSGGAPETVSRPPALPFGRRRVELEGVFVTMKPELSLLVPFRAHTRGRCPDLPQFYWWGMLSFGLNQLSEIRNLYLVDERPRRGASWVRCLLKWVFSRQRLSEGGDHDRLIRIFYH
jgi:hypothetical protein